MIAVMMAAVARWLSFGHQLSSRKIMVLEIPPFFTHPCLMSLPAVSLRIMFRYIPIFLQTKVVHYVDNYNFF